MRWGFAPASTRVTTAASQESPQVSRWAPSSHTSPGSVTWTSSSAGASSGSVNPALTEKMSMSSPAPKPVSSRLNPASRKSPSSSRSTSRSQPAFSASLLSARSSARFWAAVRPASTIVGTSSSPRTWAALRRPWPAMRPLCSSTRTGLVQPNSPIEATNCAT